MHSLSFYDSHYYRTIASLHFAVLAHSSSRCRHAKVISHHDMRVLVHDLSRDPVRPWIEQFFVVRRCSRRRPRGRKPGHSLKLVKSIALSRPVCVERGSARDTVLALAVGPGRLAHRSSFRSEEWYTLSHGGTEDGCTGDYHAQRWFNDRPHESASRRPEEVGAGCVAGIHQVVDAQDGDDDITGHISIESYRVSPPLNLQDPKSEH